MQFVLKYEHHDELDEAEKATNKELGAKICELVDVLLTVPLRIPCQMMSQILQE
jgi:hypothetical protein